MNLRIPVHTFLALALLAAPALAATRKVPSEAFPTIQDAINGAQNGDKIVVAAGTYESGFSVGEVSNLTIRFKKDAVLQGGTISLSFAEGLTLIGITMQNPNTDGAALYATHAHGLTITGLTLTGGNDDGIFLQESNDVRIVKSTVADCVGDGLQGSDCAGVVVDRCTFDGNGGWGILLGGDGSAVRVLRNRVVGSADGIAVYAVNGRIEKNTIAGTSGTGVYFWGGGLVAIQKNTLTPTDGKGIESFAEGALVSKNAVVGPSQLGLRIIGDGNLVEKNWVTGSNHAISLENNLVVVTRNMVTDSGATAFLINGNQATLSKNRAVGTDGIAFHLMQANSTMTGNVADGANWGFFCEGGAVLTKNAAIDCTTDFVSPASEGAFTLTKNRFLTFIFNYSFDPI